MVLAMFRLILIFPYRDTMAWFVIWEELSELMYIVAAWLFLLVFKGKPLLSVHQL